SSALASALNTTDTEGGLHCALALALASQLALQSAAASHSQLDLSVPPSHLRGSAVPLQLPLHLAEALPRAASQVASQVRWQVRSHWMSAPARISQVPSHWPLQLPSAWIPVSSAPAPAVQVPSHLPSHFTLAPTSAVQLPSQEP